MEVIANKETHQSWNDIKDNPRVVFEWGVGGDDKMNSSSWILHGYFERQRKLLGI